MTVEFGVGSIDFDKADGLVPVVIQDARSGAVLTVAFADREALELTIATGEMHLHSRTRGLWKKGETSGNTQRVLSLRADCDDDAVLAQVVPNGPACHTGAYSCFDPAVVADALAALDETVSQRGVSVASGEGSYTQQLLSDRNRRLKKIGEEAAEFVLASADDDRQSLPEEAADLLYHLTVALHAHGITMNDVKAVLLQRSGV